MPYTSIAFVPGSRHTYSNLGFVLLGRIVEAVSGDSIGVYIDKNILRPLEMYDSYFNVSPYRFQGRRACSYTREGDALIAHDAEFNVGITTANGGLNGSLQDMTRYASFLMRRTGGHVLSAPSHAALCAPRLRVSEDTRRHVDIGLGVFIANERDARGVADAYVGHSGFQLGHRSSLYLSVARGCGMIFWANTARRGDGNPSAGRLRERLVDTVFPLLESAP
jgi:CubicO group peptidase (beta-lactamase class C family)